MTSREPRPCPFDVRTSIRDINTWANQFPIQPTSNGEKPSVRELTGTVVPALEESFAKLQDRVRELGITPSETANSPTK